MAASVFDTVKDSVELAFSVADRLSAPILARRRRRSLVRLLYFEACRNLDLFGAFAEGKLETLKASSPAAAWLAGNLKTDAMRALLLGDSNEFKTIAMAGRSFPQAEGERELAPANLYQALKYLTVKAETLKAVLAAPKDRSLRLVNAGLRLTRIRSVLRDLLECLHDLPEIKEFGYR
jgi:hypothetical protein